MSLPRILLMAALCLTFATPPLQARSLLQKPMYYINASTNKTGGAMFWILYLGPVQCSLSRKNPGEEMQKVNVSINLRLSSSGYMEGSGYSEKGRIDCIPTMFIRSNGVERQIQLDSIDCIYDFGSRVRTAAGIAGDLVIDIEGEKVLADRLILTEYTMTGTGDDKELRKSGDDSALSAIAFGKEGIAWAAKTMSEEARTDSVKPAGR